MKPIRMRRTLIPLVGSAALALPVIEAGGAAAALSNTRQAASTKSVKFTGATVPARQWGSVTVNVTLTTTTVGKKVTRKFSDLGGGYTYHTSRSQFIMSQALPLLRQEFLVAQSAKVQMVSGATYTSEAFIQSLQSALLKAHA
jgi:FMN-binding domain